MATGVGLALTVAQTLFAALETSALKELCSMFGYKSQLEELKATVSTINSVLLDMDEKQPELSNEAQDWLDKLKDALYDVDDLLDEINTITQQQKLSAGGKNKISNKVRRFFSRSNPLLFALSKSRDIKKIQKKLDTIASNRTKFGLGTADYQSIWKRREETCSQVNEKNIVGRDGDKKNLVDRLLDSNVKGDVSFVTIVGIGGLGKTTLAKLVFNDDKIESEFESRMWVCVSNEFSVKAILGKILESLTSVKEFLTSDNYDKVGLEQLQMKVRQRLETCRYLLVLDDVWEENRSEWVKLQDFLVQGRRGSKILVTSRSEKVGEAIGDYTIYKLQGLAENDAWQLFKLMAFGTEEEPADGDLVEIGKDIVKKCANVPLSIRVIGGLLYGEDKDKWLLFQKNDLAKIEQVEKPNDGTMAILKFSYFHLTPPLKSCFRYCALFPKDYVMKKDDLIYLWMANGCIVPRYDGQSIEDAAKEYFLILSQRCFFQEINEDAYGEIFSCKVHDLMHDLALEVAGHEFLMLPSRTSHLDEKICHLSVFEGRSILNSSCDFSAKLKRMRTFLQMDQFFGMELICASNVTSIISNCGCLRWLDMSTASLKSIPTGIDRLIHLRCLDLSFNRELEELPESITNLHNLQILKLRYCHKLRALPKHFSRLVNLRHLDTSSCDALTRMPTGLKNLACLHTLPQFVIGGDSEGVQVSQLEDLKALTNLRGELHVRIVKFCWKATSKVRGGAYLLNKPHLKTLRVEFKADDQGGADVEAALLEGFQPNCDVQVLEVSQYKGAKLPCWMLGENRIRTSLPGLVKIALSGLPRVEHLPLLSQLCHLKDLRVREIPNLEYMENDRNYTPSADLIFFPSLEKLTLKCLPKIKGWWRDGVTVMVDAASKDEYKANGTGCSDTSEPSGGNGSYGISSTSSSLVFPRLRALWVLRCQNMKSFPPCPHLKGLYLSNFNEELLFMEKRGMIDNHNPTMMTSLDDSGATSITEDSCDDCHVASPVFALESLKTDNAEFTRGLPEKSLRGLAELAIEPREESLSAIGEVIESCASSLRSLRIYSAPKLKRLGGGRIEHLTCLQTLTIWDCEELELEDEDEDEDGMPWKSLHTVSYLYFANLPKMLNLPKGLQYLTALHSLCISKCNNLTALPEWIGCLTSLRSLHIEYCGNLTSLPEAMRDLTSLNELDIWGCPALIDRCRRPNGEDYPKIAHVPNLDLAN